MSEPRLEQGLAENGHEHDHEHSHDHGHDHDHNHHHHHDHEHHHGHVESVELSWASVDMEASSHEQAATVSVAIRPKPASEAAFSGLVDAMCSIARAVESEGGIVGHIKAFAKRGDVFARASVTAADLPPVCDGDQSLPLDPSADIQFVVIALLIDEERLAAICKDILE